MNGLAAAGLGLPAWGWRLAAWALVAIALLGGTACEFRRATQPVVADTVFHGGRIVTVDASFSIAEALAVSGSEILAVGRAADLLRLAGPETRLIDLAGRTVVPGLIDSHFHGIGGGPGVDLSVAGSIDEALKLLLVHVRAARPGEVIVSNPHWHEAQLREGRPPLRYDLDGIAPATPVVLRRGAYLSVLNSAALRLWEIDRETTAPEDGLIGRYPDGELNGVLLNRAQALARVPEPAPSSPPERVLRQIAEFDRLHAAGVTSLRLANAPIEGYLFLSELKRSRQLTMRVSQVLSVPANVEPSRVLSMAADWRLPPDEGDEWLRLGGAKLRVDGQFESSWMSEVGLDPWTGQRGYAGIRAMTAERFTGIVRELNRLGWRVATHASGDAAMDVVIAGYEAANVDAPIGGRRWTIEHALGGRPDQLERLARLNVVIAAQPHLYVAGPVLSRIWGPVRAAAAAPLASYHEAGLVVSLGSDAPETPYGPLRAFAHVVTRRTRDGAVLGPDERLSRRAALEAATINNAYLTLEERVKGSLETGKLADLVVLSDDLLTCPEEALGDVRVLLTMVGGRVVYTDPSFEVPQASPVDSRERR